MVDPIGTTASVITLGEFAYKVFKIRAEAKAAPAEWQRYRDGLLTVAGIQACLKSIIDKSPHVRALTIEINGKRHALVNYVNDCLSIVRDDASILLDRFEQLNPEQPKPSRQKRLARRVLSYRFVFEKSDISHLIQTVESAQSYLQSSIVLAHLHSSDAWQQSVGEVLDSINKDLESHGEALRKLHEDSNLRHASIETRLEYFAQLPDLKPKLPKWGKISRKHHKKDSPGAGRHKGKNPATALHASLSTASPLPSEVGIYGGTESTTLGSSLLVDSIQQVISDNDMDDACDDSSSEDEPVAQPTVNLGAVQQDAGGPQECSYDHVIRDGKLFQVLSDSEGNRPERHVADVVESMSDEEWNNVMDADPEELEHYITSAPCTAYPSDVEVVDDEGLIETYPQHTLVENPHSTVESASAINLSCSLVDDEGEGDMSVSDAETERPDVDAENAGVGNSDDEGEGEFINSPGFRIRRAPSDDPQAFALLQAVVLDNSSEVPRTVEWDTLLEYLHLAEKYKQELGDQPLEQAALWTRALLPQVPREFNEDAIQWLWVFWKLRMGPEFKKLSAIVQQQARQSIGQMQPSSCVNPLPPKIIALIDERRMLALCKVKNRMVQEIERERKQYLETFDESLTPPRWAAIGAMSSSLAFGYLTLESSRWLKHSSADVEAAEFDGVSFSDVCSEVQWMMNLGGWMVRSKPLSEYIPQPLAMLSAFVPLLGVGLHQQGVHGGFSSDFHDEFLALIATMKSEDWGIDLSDVE